MSMSMSLSITCKQIIDFVISFTIIVLIYVCSCAVSLMNNVRLISPQVMTISNWPNVYYDVVLGTHNSWTAIFFVALIVMANYVMLNLFVGLLLDKFSEQTQNELQKKLAKFMRYFEDYD